MPGFWNVSLCYLIVKIKVLFPVLKLYHYQYLLHVNYCFQCHQPYYYCLSLPSLNRALKWLVSCLHNFQSMLMIFGRRIVLIEPLLCHLTSPIPIVGFELSFLQMQVMVWVQSFNHLMGFAIIIRARKSYTLPELLQANIKILFPFTLMWVI